MPGQQNTTKTVDSFSMSDGSASSWLGLAEVAPSTLNSLTDETGNHSGESWSVVVIQHVSLSEKHSQQSSFENVEGISRLRDMLTTTVLQVVPSAVLSDGFLFVHPMLYEVLEQSMMKMIASLESERMDPSNDMSESLSAMSSQKLVSLASIPALTIMSTEKSTMDSHRENRSRSGFWKATVLNQVRDLPVHSRISVCILDVDDHEEGVDPIFPIQDNNDGDDKKSSILLSRITEALAGRYIIEGGVLVVSWMSFAMAVFVVTKVDVRDTDNLAKGGSNDKVYRIGTDCDEYTVSLDNGLQPPGILTTSRHGTPSPDHFNSFLEETDCPGYEPLLLELLQHAFLMTTSHMPPSDKYGGAAASGILLTGCAGVGKTRLASCLAHNLRCGDDVARMQVHWVLVHDLILRASNETNLIHYVIPSSITSSTMHESGLSWMIIVDDLHILERSSDSDDTATDMELLLVRNAILQAMDQRPSNCLFLGLGQSAKQLPTEFLRIGRLEKQIVMHPPTQSQRQAIMMKLLASTPQVKSTKTSQRDLLERWVEILAASPTAGCVAADLRRLCTDAFTRALAKQNKRMDYVSLSSFALIDILSWEDLREAARKCTPSQLAQLDVTKPTAWLIDNPTVLDNIPDETRRRHEESWHRFGGYPEVKKRVYRTVVGPWKRHIDKKTPSDSHSFGIQPPKGVLFHGPSGCGKTLAATCLASSLGLAVVQVRSSDVLDQWLGGSEAILRSLFERARAAAPCILFFDELDAIASNRAVSDQSTDVSSRLLSTFLNELDGISSSVSAKVLVVACSNRLEALDAALLRPGRLEEHVHLTTPSLSDIHDVLKLCTEQVPLNNDVDLFEVASNLSNATGADVEGICREACYVALRRLQESDLVEIRKIDFDEAIRAWK